MKKVASYSLFWCGKDDHAKLYTNGIKAICRAHHVLFPGWTWRIHHDGTIDRDENSKLLRRYESAGLVELVDMGPEERICRAMIWRMLPIWDASVEYTICRDMDSLPTPREAMAVRQFVASGRAMHCISDHPQHGAPIMGGLCGFRSVGFQRLTGLNNFGAMVSGDTLDRHGDDQLVLLRKVWPALQNHMCEHRFGGFKPASNSVAYTTPSAIDLPGVELGPFTVQADSLIPFMGVPGFNYIEAEAFYNEHGPGDVITRIRRAEA